MKSTDIWFEDPRRSKHDGTLLYNVLSLGKNLAAKTVLVNESYYHLMPQNSKPSVSTQIWLESVLGASGGLYYANSEPLSLHRILLYMPPIFWESIALLCKFDIDPYFLPIDDLTFWSINKNFEQFNRITDDFLIVFPPVSIPIRWVSFISVRSTIYGFLEGGRDHLRSKNDFVFHESKDN